MTSSKSPRADRPKSPPSDRREQAPADNPWSQSELSSLADGMNLFWSGRLEEAKEFFREDAETKIQSLLAYIEVIGLAALIGEKQEDYDEAIKLIDVLEKWAGPLSQIGATALESVKGLFYSSKISITDFQKTGGTPILAMGILIKSLLQLRFGSYVKGGYNLRRSWKLYEEMFASYEMASPQEIQSLDPTFVCALEFGVGAFQFIISLVPKSFQGIIEAIGFKADRTAGLTHLKKAAALQGFHADIASYTLLWIDIFYFENYKNARVLYSEILQRHV